MEHNVEVALLMDFYGAFLTARQQTVMQMHYEEDMSLGEIADGLGITRQGVHDALRRGETALGECEARLGLVGRYRQVQRLIGQARELTRDGRALSAQECAKLDRRLGEIAELWEGSNGL
ncbi:MAG: sigma factor-like helix-turn-helix DNA-binding protein [Eubacteriales bacterium]|nr:sigma factor-like helix-turn-helix DNA-binding protein [Eubacteriales bacterium]